MTETYSLRLAIQGTTLLGFPTSGPLAGCQRLASTTVATGLIVPSVG
jgi:hypothetical protein